MKLLKHFTLLLIIQMVVLLKENSASRERKRRNEQERQQRKTKSSRRNQRDRVPSFLLEETDSQAEIDNFVKRRILVGKINIDNDEM